MEQTYFGKIKRAARSEYKNQRKMRLIILILTIAGSLFELGEYNVMNRHDYETGMELGEKYAYMGGFFGLFLMFTAAFFGAFAVYGIFRDLTSKQTADVQLSLPMSAKDRYLSKLLALGEIHIFSLAVSGVGVSLIANSIHMSPELIGYLLRFHVVVLAVALFVDAICIFCMCCCGAKAEGVYTSIITGLCVSFTPFMFFTLAVQEFSGVDISNIAYNKFFSLIGLMTFMWMPEVMDDVPAIEAWILLLGNMALSGLLAYGSFYIYRKRDGRQVGKPMVYSLFMELFMFVGLFTLFTLFFYTGGWGIGITIAAIIYLIIRIVSARAKITPKMFMGWIGKYAASFAVFYVIMGVAYFSGGFGYYKLRQTKIDRDTVKISVEVMHRERYEDLRQTFITKEKEFDNTFYIDRHGDRSEDPYYYSYINDALSAEEVQEKLMAVNRIIDERYTLKNRTIEDFSSTMFHGSLSSRLDYQRTGTSVNVYVWNTDNFSEVYRRPYSYNVSFWIPNEEYEEICSELEEILVLTSAYSNDPYNDDEPYEWEIYDWEIYDY